MKKPILIMLLLACLISGLSFLIRSAKRAACEMSCDNTFKQLGLALQNYGDTFGTLPPAITLGIDGLPKHSWRPLILNFLVASPPFYDHDDAWDGPNNERLINGHVFRPEELAENVKGGEARAGPIDLSIYYQCCAHQSNLKYSTNIVAVTGPETLWPGTESRQLIDIPDGAQTTIMLVETNSLDIYWSEPKDLEFSSMSFEINAKSDPSISSNHPTGPAVLMANGAVYRLSPQTPPEVIRALLTYQGGEALQMDELIRDGYLISGR